MGIAGYKTRIKLGGPITPFTDQTVTYDGTTSIYQIASSYMRVWNPDTNIQGIKLDGDLVIEVDENFDTVDPASWIKPTIADIESINLLFGKVKFVDTYANDPADAGGVRISGEYIPITEGDQYIDGDPTYGGAEWEDMRVAYCDSYDLTFECTVLDKTGYKEAQITNGHRHRDMGLLDSNASLTGFGHLSQKVTDALYDRDTMLIEVIPGNGSEIYRGWYVVESESLSGGVDDLENGDLSFQLDTQFPEDKFHVSMGWSDVV